ncbi:ArsR/SmtB family transcription factor [Glutamicibacter protophormiae]|uniref:ArsR/SmtB family transcription factor n=1 Tax=Glutamicibacter protophormiae TaxID=37930 RepID=UPI00195A223A|nr:helix-turn-helix domain-containing protein [Glutamicibacter protophormiae]QRQ77782.1 helix-turn-helix transcriptional regulator [Glutamicibacter protophormiae]WPR63794.1 helix-turn-helix domain-containing protein [Glutamicibacter protophormiae]WPR67289.1 helix-turn-helix domain-containing protein [Glutamicibacter protophormiae]
MTGNTYQEHALATQDGKGAVPQVVSITDPQAIRALAHDARLIVLDELFASQTTRTATELASLCDLTPSAMSYHLRALEKYGYVIRAASEGDARERRWRAAGERLELNTQIDSANAKTAYLNVQLNAFRTRLNDEVQRREAEAKAGIAPSPDRPPMLTSGLVFLSEEKQLEFNRRLLDLVYEYEAMATAEERSIDSQRMFYLISLLPEYPSVGEAKS